MGADQGKLPGPARGLCWRTAQTRPHFLQELALVPGLFPQRTLSAGTVATFPLATVVVKHLGGKKENFIHIALGRAHSAPKQRSVLKRGSDSSRLSPQIATTLARLESSSHQ